MLFTSLMLKKISKRVGTCNYITTNRIGFAFQTTDCNFFYL